MAVKNIAIIGQGKVALKTSTFLPKPTPAPKDMDKFAFGDLKEVSIDSLQLWKNNPRKNDTAVPKLAAILKNSGQKSPIVVWKKNNVVYKGNTTLKAMKYNGAKTIWALFVDFPSEQAAEAYGIADNKSSEWSDWDEDLLKQLMSSSDEINAASTGFSEKELKAFQLSTSGGMEALPNLTIQGDSEDLGEFMILTFPTKLQLNRFKEAFSLGENARKVDLKDLCQAFQPDWSEFIDQDLDQ